jgi:hypothetical protein
MISTNGQFPAGLSAVDTTVTDTSLVLSNPLAATTRYYWKVSAVNLNGASAYSSPSVFTTGTGLVGIDHTTEIPREFALLQNYPNPFNPSTTISYDVPKEAYVKITIYDMLGRVVANLVDELQSANRYTLEWNPSHLSSGIYFYRFEARSQDGSGNFSAVKKLLYMK